MAGFFANAKGMYEQTIDFIVRPPRAQYTKADLGPVVFRIGERVYERRDLSLTNSRNLELCCSWFRPYGSARESETPSSRPCVVYAHGNCGCRLDALSVLPVVVPLGCSVFALDFSGSGLSQGDYISLGWHEKEDIAAAVAFLREQASVSSIALWGRSMGAVTSLMYAASDPSIAALVLDSPFSSLDTLAREIVEHNNELLPVSVPSFAVGIGLRFIRNSILTKARFDIDKLDALSLAPSIFVPALFIHGLADTFIIPKHSQTLAQHYGGDHDIILVRGDHNSVRDQMTRDRAGVFLCHALHIPPEGLPILSKMFQGTQDLSSIPVLDFSLPDSYVPPEVGSDGTHSSGSVGPHGLGVMDDDAMLQEAIRLSLEDPSAGVVVDDDEHPPKDSKKKEK
eukprot:TRINITY_DN6765_c0_g1_i1.p1 TRINITY_DN6765_c0_g1~~TRINITY_DN6765_c0_g1_i1.p1  ORF type:complete len:397 (-),score=79.90 TRINITY_DN6765_c0_g1_i1:178-1368(-)